MGTRPSPAKTSRRFLAGSTIARHEADLGEDELPFPCREYHLPGTTKTIYYALDAASGIVKVFALLDQRRNPANRFRGIDESRLEDF